MYKCYFCNQQRERRDLRRLVAYSAGHYICRKCTKGRGFAKNTPRRNPKTVGAKSKRGKRGKQH